MIFLSYRRSDSEIWVGRIFDHLKFNYGQDNIFYDRVSLPVGSDFHNDIKQNIWNARVILVVIGHTWLSDANAGVNRLFQDNDFVKLEIEYALRFKKVIIPILLDDAPLPNADEIPYSIAGVLRHNACQMRTRHFESDMKLLIRTIDKLKPSLFERILGAFGYNQISTPPADEDLIDPNQFKHLFPGSYQIDVIEGHHSTEGMEFDFIIHSHSSLGQKLTFVIVDSFNLPQVSTLCSLEQDGKIFTLGEPCQLASADRLHSAFKLSDCLNQGYDYFVDLAQKEFPKVYQIIELDDYQHQKRDLQSCISQCEEVNEQLKQAYTPELLNKYDKLKDQIEHLEQLLMSTRHSKRSQTSFEVLYVVGQRAEWTAGDLDLREQLTSNHYPALSIRSHQILNH